VPRKPRAVAVTVDERVFTEAAGPQRKRLRELAVRLEADPFLGDRIRESRIPKVLRDLPDLNRQELQGGWRALHTVAGPPLRILVMGSVGNRAGSAA
jgi:hypothetical protein